VTNVHQIRALRPTFDQNDDRDDPADAGPAIRLPRALEPATMTAHTAGGALQRSHTGRQR
jgi:hypothetical protein